MSFEQYGDVVVPVLSTVLLLAYSSTIVRILVRQISIVG